MVFRKAFLNVLRNPILGELSTVTGQHCRVFSSDLGLSNDKTKKADFYKKEREQQVGSILSAFASQKNSSYELHKWNPLTITKQRRIEWKNKIQKEVELEQQKYIAERHELLGSDLASAHFIVFRGGKVRFEGSKEWVEKDEYGECPQLPKVFVRGMYLHSLDASNTDIRYEALVNFANLNRLKWLSFRNCRYVDDWFLDRISSEYSSSLEHLDVSECNGISERGLSCIYKLRNLKTLTVTNIADTRSFEYMCLLLEDSKPDLSIEGVKYIELETSK